MSLIKDSEQFRIKNLAKNTYNNGKVYNSSHPNALSDGDEYGKGENNGQIGSLTDNKERARQLVKNKYSPNNSYDVGSIE